MEEKNGRRSAPLPPVSYLILIHFKFPNHLDRDLVHLASHIPRAVNIAKGSIAHLFQQHPALQARILRHLRPALPLLGYQLLYVGPRHLGLGIRDSLRCRLAASMSGVEGIEIAGGGLILALWLALLLDMYGRDIRGGLSMGSHQARLLAMAYKILEALNRTHGRRMSSCDSGANIRSPRPQTGLQKFDRVVPPTVENISADAQYVVDRV